MKATFRLHSSTVTNGIKHYTWICIGGATQYRGMYITEGCTYSQPAWAFWNDEGAMTELLIGEMLSGRM